MILGVDINPHACAVAARTAAQNDTTLEIVRSDLLSALPRLSGKVDILVFNPPYVPTEETEYVSSHHPPCAHEQELNTMTPGIRRPKAIKASAGLGRGEETGWA